MSGENLDVVATTAVNNKEKKSRKPYTPRITNEEKQSLNGGGRITISLLVQKIAEKYGVSKTYVTTSLRETRVGAVPATICKDYDIALEKVMNILNNI